MATVSFENRVVIVTGAGGGLGRTYALDIARRGGAVLVNDLGCDVDGTGSSRELADRVVTEIRAAGGRAVASYDSVASAEGAQQIAATALEAFGRIDALINNAGNLRDCAFESYSVQDFEALIATHLAGAFHMTQAVWPHMKKCSYGRIVFTSSSSGIFGNALQCAYGAAKAGIVGLMNVVSHEGEPHGILCNALMPNAVTTRMAARAGDNMEPAERAKAVAALALLGNSVEPTFTTGIAVFLASETCRSTHEIYSSLGGRVARVFIGVGHGWQGSRAEPSTADDIAAHLDQIRDVSNGFEAPLSPVDEHRCVIARASEATRNSK